MKTADISAALLTGFGKEVIETGNFDIENERRKSKLMQRPIGNNRMSMTRGPRRKLSRDEKRVLEKGGAGTCENSIMSLYLFIYSFRLIISLLIL